MQARIYFPGFFCRHLPIKINFFQIKNNRVFHGKPQLCACGLSLVSYGVFCPLPSPKPILIFETTGCTESISSLSIQCRLESISANKLKCIQMDQEWVCRLEQTPIQPPFTYQSMGLPLLGFLVIPNVSSNLREVLAQDNFSHMTSQWSTVKLGNDSYMCRRCLHLVLDKEHFNQDLKTL